MHVVFFADQHLESLGGAQVSMRLQHRFLERAGHTVTVVAPRMHGERAAAYRPEPAYVDTPSIPITLDREYSFTWPGRRTDRFVDDALAGRPPVDVVHVQADFWGALLAYRFAERHGLPVVHTMHNRVDVGIEATTPFPGLVLRVLNAWQRRTLRADAAGRSAAATSTVGEAAASGANGRRGGGSGHDGWAYLRGFAARAHAVTAPSSHFARRLDENGVVPGRAGAGDARVDVIWNGMDDALLDDALEGQAERVPGPARLVWLGRMSPEKRLLPFLEALADSGVAADVEVLGGGAQRRAAQKLIERRGLDRADSPGTVTFGGRLSHTETLRRLAAADAVVQTSIGFETQGMTVFEAASLGTPSIVSDPDIGHELGSGFWPVADASTAALAATLREAVADIDAGRAPEPDPGIAERFRQSSRTAAMVEVYERVIAS